MPSNGQKENCQVFASVSLNSVAFHICEPANDNTSVSPPRLPPAATMVLPSMKAA